MIQNRRQHSVTKGQIARLRHALEASRAAKAKMAPRVYKAMLAGIESQIDELQQQVREYEKLEKATALELRSADELPDILIKARVARGYTQKDLAEKLDLKPQQIQKYEATRYRSASLSRLLDIMKALGLELQAKIPLRSHK